MSSTSAVANLLLICSLIGSLLSCTTGSQPSGIEELEATYQQMLTGKQGINLDSLKVVADQLGQAYLVEVEKDSSSEGAAEYLFKAANLYESSFMNPAYSLKLYNRLLENFPSSSRVPETLFKTGFIYHNVLQDLPKARETFEAFLEQYPNHELAVSAQSEIDNLGISPDSILKRILEKQGESL